MGNGKQIIENNRKDYCGEHPHEDYKIRDEL